MTRHQIDGHMLLGCRTIWLVMCLLFASTALAQPSEPEPSISDPSSLETFFSELVPVLQAKHEVPGVVVSVVADGQVKWLAGYGLATLEPERPAEADTPFATGSVGKLFTWFAVMQLVERGEIDLDADVNIYLDFELPGGFDESVTMRHLLTHTPGFEDYPMIGLFSRDAEKVPPLGQLVADKVPARLWPPGVEAAYSNYGTGLAGYIVERVSGVPFSDYVQREILTPLGMTRSSFEQPLPPELADESAKGYLAERSGGFKPGGAEYVSLPPAGGMVMSAADAARFMLVHLSGGELDGKRVLETETIEEMHTTLFKPDTSLPGNAYGFWESARHGERILVHGGDTMLFHTQLALFPEREAGFYLATNAPGGTALRDAIWEEFLDHFFPVPAPKAISVPTSAERDRYAGLYGMNRASTTSLAKVASLFQVLEVRSEGEVLVTEFFGSEHRWVPQEDGSFADIEREGEVALFQVGANGQVAAYVSEAPMMVFRKLRWFETPQWHGGLLVGSSIVLLSGLILLPILAWRDRRKRSASLAEQRVRWFGGAASLLPLVFVGTFFLVMTDPMGPAFGVSPLLAAALVIGVVAALAIAAFAMLMIFAWLLDWWRLAARVHATLVAIAGLLLLWQMNYWNLLGFKI
jgi:CubicO group peptidase (beta-lactamase class C family)